MRITTSLLDVIFAFIFIFIFLPKSMVWKNFAIIWKTSAPNFPQVGIDSPTVAAARPGGSEWRETSKWEIWRHISWKNLQLFLKIDLQPVVTVFFSNQKVANWWCSLKKKLTPRDTTGHTRGQTTLVTLHWPKYARNIVQMPDVLERKLPFICPSASLTVLFPENF